MGAVEVGEQCFDQRQGSQLLSPFHWVMSRTSEWAANSGLADVRGSGEQATAYQIRIGGGAQGACERAVVWSGLFCSDRRRERRKPCVKMLMLLPFGGPLAAGNGSWAGTVGSTQQAVLLPASNLAYVLYHVWRPRWPLHR